MFSNPDESSQSGINVLKSDPHVIMQIHERISSATDIPNMIFPCQLGIQHHPQTTCRRNKQDSALPKLQGVNTQSVKVIDIRRGTENYGLILASIENQPIRDSLVRNMLSTLAQSV